MKGVGIVAGTKNDCELIDFFIQHHLRLGFTKIHLMDFNSTDGSREILQKYIKHPQLDIILSDANHGTPTLHRWLRLRAYLEPSTDHVFYLDPDEMLVLKPNTSIQDVIIVNPNIVNEIPRYNIVSPVSLQNGISESLLQNLHKMYFHTPTTTVNFPILPENEWIEWIKQPIPGKVLHQKVPVQVSLGGHYVISPTIKTLHRLGKTFIAHFPVTTYERMVCKIRSLKSLITENPHLKDSFFRYIRICYVYEQGLGKEMFEKLYLSRDEVKTLRNLHRIKSGNNLLNRPNTSIDSSSKKPSSGKHYEISMELAMKTMQE